MDDLLNRFRLHLRQERMRQPRTVLRYCSALGSFAVFLGSKADKVELDRVDKQLVVEYLRLQANRGEIPSRSVWNTHLAALRAFFGFLVKEGIIMANPAMLVERMKMNSAEPNPLSLDEAIRLVEAIEANASAVYRARDVAIVQVLFHCALRVAELVSLDVAQVDFDNYAFLSVRTKGDKRLSAVFNDVVAEAVGRCLRDREQVGATPEERALFLSDRRKRLSVRAVQAMVRHYAELAGISRRVSPHLLRHSSATQLVEIGTPLNVVKEICGHASVTTTQRYVHVSSGQRKLAVDALGAQWRRRSLARKVASPKVDEVEVGSA